ncbi:MAG: hypothetical protein ACSLFH_06365 [Desulfuromonadales bacterium]
MSETKSPQLLLNSPYWSFLDAVEIGAWKKFDKQDTGNLDQLVFRAELISALMKGIRKGKISRLKKDRDFYGLDLDSPIGKFLKWSFLLLIPAIGYLILASNSVDFLFQKDPSRVIFVSLFFAPYLLHAVSGSAWIAWHFASGKLARKAKDKHSYAVFRSELFGISEEQLESDTVIDYLNAEFRLNLPKDPFRVWNEPFFKRNGEVWLVGYNRARFSLKIDRGSQDIYERIAYLLRHPYKEDISCLSLVSKGSPDNHFISNEPMEDDESDYTKFKSAVDDRNLPKEGIIELIDSLKKDLEIESDIEKREELEEKIKYFERYMKQTYSKSGAQKPVKNADIQARDSIKKNKERIVLKIADFSPELSAHLKNYINFSGTTVSYKPPPDPPDWDVSY